MFIKKNKSVVPKSKINLATLFFFLFLSFSLISSFSVSQFDFTPPPTFNSSANVSSVTGVGYIDVSPNTGDVVVSLNGNDLNTTISQLASSGIQNNTNGWWVNFSRTQIDQFYTPTNSFPFTIDDDGSNAIIDFPTVGGNNYIELATSGGFFQLYANPNPSNDYLLATITETQGSTTELNFYEGGVGHNRFWDSGSGRFGGVANSLCDVFGGVLFPDCDSSTTGADVIIQDELWLGGRWVSGNGTAYTTDEGDIISNRMINASSEVYINGVAVSPWLYNQTGAADSDWNVSGSNLFPNDLSNDVGIGTSSPQTNFDIWTNNSDTSLWSRFPAMQIVNQNRGTNTWEGLQFSDGDQIAAGILTRFTNPGSNYGQLYLSVRGAGGFLTNAQVIDTDGDVGLGIASPETHLHVYGAGNQRIKVESTNNQAGISLESDSGGEMIIYSPDSSNDLRIYSSTASSDVFVVEDTGEVGIGYTTPSSFSTGFQTVISKSSDQYVLALRNANAGASTIMLGFFGDTTRKGYIQYLNDSSRGNLRLTNEYGDLSFLTGSNGNEVSRLTLDYGGNLTVHTSSNWTSNSGLIWAIGCSGTTYTGCVNSNAPDIIYGELIRSGQPTTTGSVIDRAYNAFGKGITTYAGSGLPSGATDIQAGYFALTKSAGEGGILKSVLFSIKDISDTGVAPSLQGARFESVKDGLSTGGALFGLQNYIRNIGGGVTGNTFANYYDVDIDSNGTNLYYNYYANNGNAGISATKYLSYNPQSDTINYDNGYLGLGLTAPSRQLDVLNDARVRGRFAYDTNGGASSTFVCRDASNNLTACTSLESRKNDIINLSSVNINNTFDKIRTIQFKYEGSDHNEYGYSADQLNEIDPSLSTFDNVPIKWENITKTRPKFLSINGSLVEDGEEEFTEQIITEYQRELVGVNLFAISALQTDEVQKLKKRNSDLEIQVIDLQQENEAYGLRVTDVEQENTQLKNRLNQVESSLCSLGVQRYCSGFGVGSGETLG